MELEAPERWRKFFPALDKCVQRKLLQVTAMSDQELL
jgi:hypothetical protein